VIAEIAEALPRSAEATYPLISMITRMAHGAWRDA
jgi:hypothetical protein